MQKYIHYCWFGDKPMPKLAKKCIKSWKKYLPDFEIKKWDETNIDLKENYFIEAAYKNKKWAFVSDYVRAKVLNEYGGIYFDTDMEVVKNIDELLKDKSFLGLEDSGYVAVGVWYEKEKNSELTKKLIKEYMSIKEMNFKNISEYSNYSIPKMISKILEKYNLKYSYDKIQKLDNGTTVYPRDYFYPYSYDRKDNLFSENTSMIHYYDASWIPKRDQMELKMIRMFGLNITRRILKTLSIIKRMLRNIIKFFTFPILKLSNIKKQNKQIKEEINILGESLSKIKQNSYIVLHNPDWLGTTYATKEILNNLLPIKEIVNKKQTDQISNLILSKKPKMVIFSAFSLGWQDLAKQLRLKDEDLIIKVIWHGSNSLNVEDYDWQRFKEIFNLLDIKIINSIGFVKKSMADFYKKKGYNSEFVMNNLYSVEEKIKTNKNIKEKLRIGIYSSGDRWVKNFYNQLAASSLFDDVTVDCIPTSQKTFDFARILKLKITGVDKPIAREDLIERMGKNDINVYVTFTECAPLLPLESFATGVPCITGNNHHYFENTKLREYLVVDENDDPNKIYEKIKFCLENKTEILELYNKWKKEYDKEAKENIEKFREGIK